MKIMGSASIQSSVFAGIILPVPALQRAYVQEQLTKGMTNSALRVALILDPLAPTYKPGGPDFREKEDLDSIYVGDVENVCKDLKVDIIITYNKVVNPRVLEALSAMSVLVIPGQALLTMNSLVTLSKAGIVQNIQHLKEAHIGSMVIGFYLICCNSIEL